MRHCNKELKRKKNNPYKFHRLSNFQYISSLLKKISAPFRNQTIQNLPLHKRNFHPPNKPILKRNNGTKRNFPCQSSILLAVYNQRGEIIRAIREPFTNTVERIESSRRKQSTRPIHFPAKTYVRQNVHPAVLLARTRKNIRLRPSAVHDMENLWWRDWVLLVARFSRAPMYAFDTHAKPRKSAIDPCFSFFLRVSKTIFERIATRFRCANVVGRFANKAKHQETFARSLTLVEVAFSKCNRGMLMSKDRNVFSYSSF